MGGIIILSGCSLRNSEINTSVQGLVNNIDTGEVMQNNVIENLSAEQQDVELNKALATLKTTRKTGGETIKDGMSTSIIPNGADLPNQPKNKPEFNESYNSVLQLIALTNDYVQNVLKIPKRSYGYDITPAVDPRILAIYDDKDKGVATGYTNENIEIYEYETEVDDSYSYLFLVRDSKESPWKIIHHGTSYKEQ